MITKIKITNFKSIKNAEVNFDRFNVIIGKNSSGKSTLVSAINLTEKLASGQKLNEIVQKIAPMHNELFNVSDRHTETKIEAYIKSGKKDNLYKLSYTISLDRESEPGGLTIEEETLDRVSENKEQPIYYRYKNRLYETRNRSKMIPLKLDRDKLALASYSEEPASEVAKTLYNSSFINGFDIDKMGGIRIVDSSSPVLESLDGIAVSLYQKNQEQYEEAIEAIKEIIPYFERPKLLNISDAFKDIKRPDDSNEEKKSPQFLVRWKEKNFSADYSYTSLSGGDKRTIFILFTLFYLSPSSTLIIEEVENGIHLNRVSKLIDQLRTQSYYKKVQIILTTHSTQVLNEITPKEVIYVKRDVSNGSFYKALTETEQYELIKKDLTETASAKDYIDTGAFEE